MSTKFQSSLLESRRFRLKRSISLSDTVAVKNIRGVSTLFRRKHSAKHSSTPSWTHYQPGQIVRERGVDFEIVSPIPERMQSAEPSHTSQQTLKEQSKGFAYRLQSAVRRISSLEVCSTSRTINFQPFQLPELHRQSSCDSWLQYFEQTLPEGHDTTEAANKHQEIDQGEAQVNLKSEHRIRRKPVPMF